MEFHHQKCSVLHITRSRNPKYKQCTLHGHILVKEDNATYLGVGVNKTLSWIDHIYGVTKKANASLNSLGRNLKINQEHFKNIAYLTFVRPQLEYGTRTRKRKKTKLWWSKDGQHDMFVTTTTVKQVSLLSSTMIKHLHWGSLLQRRSDIRLVMFYKTLHGIVALKLFPQLIPLVRPSRHKHSEATPPNH